MTNTPEEEVANTVSEEEVTSIEQDEFSGDPVIREEVNKKILYFAIIAVVIATLIIGFIYSKNSNNAPQVSTEVPTSNEERILSVEGVVLAMDYDSNEATVVLSRGREGLTQYDDLDGVSKKVKITPNTVVQKLVFSKDREKLIDQSDTIEVNVTDIFKNDRLIIEYAGLKNDEIIENVKSISIVIETETFDKTYADEVAKISREPFLGIKGKVVSVDENKSAVTYYPYSLGKLSTEVSIASLEEKSNIYTVSNESRIDIEHAKTQITWGDISEGDIVFIVVNPEIDLTEANHKNMTAESFLLVK